MAQLSAADAKRVREWMTRAGKRLDAAAAVSSR